GHVALAEPGRFEHQRQLLRLVLEFDQVADLDPIARDGDAPAVDLDVAVVDELARREHRGDELGAIDHGIEPALEQPDHVRAGIALHADGLGVDAAELPLGDIAVIAAQLLLGAQLHAVVGELALAALAVLAGPVFPAVDGALGAVPHVLAHSAVDLVLRLVALGHRVLTLVSGRGSRPPLSRSFRDRQVLPEAPDETAGRETARGPESPRRARFLRGKPGQVKPTKPRLAGLLVNVDFDRARDERAPGLQVGLHPRVAGDALAIELEEFGGVVFDLVHEAGRVVHVLQQADPPPAERLEERRRRFHQRREMAGVCRRQREFELYRSSYRPRFIRHRCVPRVVPRRGNSGGLGPEADASALPVALETKTRAASRPKRA